VTFLRSGSQIGVLLVLEPPALNTVFPEELGIPPGYRRNPYWGFADGLGHAGDSVTTALPPAGSLAAWHRSSPLSRLCGFACSRWQPGKLACRSR
jgi:hypothetical protein